MIRFFQAQRFVFSKQDASSWPIRTVCHCQAGHFVVYTQDNALFSSKTMRRSQAGQWIASEQDNSSLPSRTVRHSQAGHFHDPTKDISLFPNGRHPPTGKGAPRNREPQVFCLSLIIPDSFVYDETIIPMLWFIWDGHPTI